MKSWEALKLLHEGKKVRLEDWERGLYIVLKNGNLCDETGRAVDNPDWFFSSNREWEEVKDWIVTGKFGIETRDFVWVRCPYCSSEIRKTITSNRLVQFDRYCPYCGEKVTK